MRSVFLMADWQFQSPAVTVKGEFESFGNEKLSGLLWAELIFLFFEFIIDEVR